MCTSSEWPSHWLTECTCNHPYPLLQASPQLQPEEPSCRFISLSSEKRKTHAQHEVHDASSWCMRFSSCLLLSKWVTQSWLLTNQILLVNEHGICWWCWRIQIFNVTASFFLKCVYVIFMVFKLIDIDACKIKVSVKGRLLLISERIYWELCW